MRIAYPNLAQLVALAKLALNAAFIKSDITGDGVPETYCNNFVHMVAVGMGCDELSRVDGTALGMNEQLRLMRTRPGWTELKQDWEMGARWASEGYLVIAGLEGQPNGHGCVLVPGECQASPSWGGRVPMVANVGARNFYNDKLSWAFAAARKPTLFGWKGPIGG
jgi:hypothetical protein